MINILKKIIYPPYDKLEHFYIGTLISSFTALALSAFFDSKYKILVFIITAIFALGWEYYRFSFKKYKFDWCDIVFSVIPAILITIIMYF